TLFCVSQGGTFPEITGLAWDCGAVTTGPLTVPIVLSLGVGIAANARRGSVTSADEPSLSGFGIVTFASLFPVFSVWAIGWAFGGRSVTVDPFREAARCFSKLARLLLEGRDAELERLPDAIAAGLLTKLAAKSAMKEDLAQGLRTWLQRRPLKELILRGKGQSHDASKCLEVLRSPSACSRVLEISAFSNLQMLCISHAATLKDADLAVLPASRLETLQLQDCPGLTGDFVEYLHLPAGSLRRLLCKDCGGISDRPLLGRSGKAGIGELTQSLIQLGFSGSARLSDEFVAVLTGGMAPAPLPRVSASLSYLDLSKTQISDSCLPGLSRLETLSCLALSRTKVSMQGLRELSKRLGLKTLLPNRPKVLLRSFSAAQDLDAEIFPAWASQAAAALDPLASLGSKDLAFWPEAAVRHATALALFQAALSRKRPSDTPRPSLST
ncbi:umpA, partial [Symbiodinium sp. KB8]